MNKILIKNKEENENSWIFLVNIDGSEYVVTVDKEYYKELNISITIDELIKKSFQFLLERESKESILKKFNINIIKQYFPEYEQVIKKL